MSLVREASLLEAMTELNIGLLEAEHGFSYFNRNKTPKIYH